MTAITFTLRPRTAFATPLLGDTLFGQICWAIRHGWGEARLIGLLDGYTSGKPFLIVSDAFPSGTLPLPALPSVYWASTTNDPKERKALKKITWIPIDALDKPMQDWQRFAKDRPPADAHLTQRQQPRNSLNRLTNATGKGDGFSPYTVRQHWFAHNAVLDLHVWLDETRLARAELADVLTAIGTTGFGKDAGVGLGKFDIDTPMESALITHTAPDAWLTLAPCAPQELGWNATRSFYRPFTRYGRHGDEAARREAPFKAPLLLAAAGALLAPLQENDWSRGWIGQGLGGNGQLSHALPQTVHQGYAPAIPVRLPEAV